MFLLQNVKNNLSIKSPPTKYKIDLLIFKYSFCGNTTIWLKYKQANEHIGPTVFKGASEALVMSSRPTVRRK